tara:strand:+ start:7372 stop:7851 length:480 start_codon:yes stop_codon:yes gene_type:complete
MSDTDTREDSPTPELLPGAAYFDAVLESLEEAVQEYRRGSEELPINTNCLCVDPMTEPIEVEEWFDDEGDMMEEPLMITLEEEKITGHKFVVTTGGPHAEFQTTDNGGSWSFFYCDWFGSDSYKSETFSTGWVFDLINEAFGIWFECGVPEGQELGAWV